MQKNNIILIGFMGSGKSAFGRWSSNNIHMNFCDTDEYIEEKMKKMENLQEQERTMKLQWNI